MAKKKIEYQEEEQSAQIHFWIPENLKKYWKKKFEERGHKTYKSGIVAAVFSYLHLQGFQKSEMDTVISELQKHLGYLHQIEDKF